jgi:hypothetical protein
MRPGLAYLKPKAKKVVTRLGEYVRGEIPGTIIPQMIHGTIEEIKNLPTDLPEYMQSVGEYGASPDIQYTPQMAARGMGYTAEAIGLGAPGGLPAGATGVGITKRQAAQGIFKDLVSELGTKIGSDPSMYSSPYIQKQAARYIRGASRAISGMRPVPEEAIQYLRKAEFQVPGLERSDWRGWYQRGKRQAAFTPSSTVRTPPHEIIHHSQEMAFNQVEAARNLKSADKFKADIAKNTPKPFKMTPGREVMVDEAEALRNRLLGLGKDRPELESLIYDVDPYEIQSRHMASLMESMPEMSFKEYERLFFKTLENSLKVSKRAARERFFDEHRIALGGYPFD